MNKKFISHSNYVFRKVLNSENYLEILKNFIEAFLDVKIEKIELNKYLEEKAKTLPKEENFGIADVRIKTDENEEINVGIQFVDGMYYAQTKMLLYYAQIHLNQLEYDKREFARTITINIFDSNFFASRQYEKTIRIQSNESSIRLEELEMKVIELSKFKTKNLDIEELNNKEEWMVYLKGDDNIKIEKVKNKNKYIKSLDELVEKYWREEKME